MTDYVSIRDLSVSAVIGVHAWEREIEQTLVFSVDMAADVRRAAASDDLADALDYSAVAERPSPRSCAKASSASSRPPPSASPSACSLISRERLRLELRKPITDGGYTAVITIERPLP